MDYLASFHAGQRSLAYFFLDKQRRLARWGGSLTTYSLEGIQCGEDMQERFPFLGGMDFDGDESVVLPLIAIKPAVYAEVHVIGAKSGLWIVLLDRTKEAEQYQTMLQDVNETKLLREQLRKVTRELRQARARLARLEDEKSDSRLPDQGRLTGS